MPVSGKRPFSATVFRNRPLRTRIWRLDLDLEPPQAGTFLAALPGQFAELRLSDLSLPRGTEIPEDLRDVARRQIILRRPFSFCEIRKTARGARIGILYNVRGPGTLRMTTLTSGDPVSLIGPLGDGFQIPSQLRRALLVAGGMGAPPIEYMAEYLSDHHPDVEVVAFAGARNLDDLPYDVQIDNEKGALIDEFRRLNVESRIATDDGSVGFRGLVTGCLEQWLDANGPSAGQCIVYACGPEPMLAATAALAEKWGLECQLSMERMMACGIGLCQSCVVPVRSSDGSVINKLCCKDGPVFCGKDVIFE